jgi:ribosome-binding factor A
MNTPRRYPRTARVNEVMLEVLADELERLSDPRLEFVTITGVDVNRDLSKATVYYSSLGDLGRAGSGAANAGTKRNGGDARDAARTPEAAAAALESATPHLRSVLSRQVRVKHVPKLVFVPDPAIASGQRIEAILRDIHRQEDADAENES